MQKKKKKRKIHYPSLLLAFFFFQILFNKLRGKYFHIRNQGHGELSMHGGKELGIRVAWLSVFLEMFGLADSGIHIILLLKEQKVWF